MDWKKIFLIEISSKASHHENEAKHMIYKMLAEIQFPSAKTNEGRPGSFVIITIIIIRLSAYKLNER